MPKSVPKIEVPQLLKKLKLLRRHHRLDWPQFCSRTGKPKTTWETWGSTDPARNKYPEHIPDEMMAVLRQLFASILPPSYPRDEAAIQALITGDYHYLEQEIERREQVIFHELIDREGLREGVRLIRRGDVNLIEIVDQTDLRTIEALRRGEEFRIEVTLQERCRYALVLQNTQSLWAEVAAYRDTDEKLVFVPGLGEQGQPRFMAERSDTGRHRFICLQTAAPLPLIVEKQISQRTTLTSEAIGELATFYRGQKGQPRALHVLDLHVE